MNDQALGRKRPEIWVVGTFFFGLHNKILLEGKEYNSSAIFTKVKGEKLHGQKFSISGKMIVDISFDIVEYTLNSIYKPFTSWNYIFFISEPYVLKILFSPQAFSTLSVQALYSWFHWQTSQRCDYPWPMDMNRYDIPLLKAALRVNLWCHFALFLLIWPNIVPDMVCFLRLRSRVKRNRVPDWGLTEQGCSQTIVDM